MLGRGMCVNRCSVWHRLEVETVGGKRKCCRAAESCSIHGLEKGCGDTAGNRRIHQLVSERLL